VTRIGREPAPMVADFAQLVASHKVWVLEEREIYGFIVMFPKDTALQIENVAVDPIVHGNGYGGKLLAFAESEAKAANLDRITLYTNVHMTENLSFYPSHGYRESGRRAEEGFDRVYFSKEIAMDSVT